MHTETHIYQTYHQIKNHVPHYLQKKTYNSFAGCLSPSIKLGLQSISIDESFIVTSCLGLMGKDQKSFQQVLQMRDDVSPCILIGCFLKLDGCYKETGTPIVAPEGYTYLASRW